MARTSPSPRAKAPAKAPSLPTPPYFVAARAMMRNGEKIKVGDVIPDAATWPRLESWIRARYVKEVTE